MYTLVAQFKIASSLANVDLTENKDKLTLFSDSSKNVNLGQYDANCIAVAITFERATRKRLTTKKSIILSLLVAEETHNLNYLSK